MRKKPTSLQHSVFSTPKIQSLNVMCSFGVFFMLVHLIKSKLAAETKLKLLFRFSLYFLPKERLDPVNGNSSELEMVL